MAIGSVCWSVMVSLGEMVAYLPIPGGHIKLAERFVDHALSFTMGWNYWYNWIIILPAELSAAAVLIDFWNKDINLNPGVYGEAEFIFASVPDIPSFFFTLTPPSSIKVITIVALIIGGIVLDLGGARTLVAYPMIQRLTFLHYLGGPNHDRIGFRYWKNPFNQYNDIPGAKGQFLGWWAVMTQAAFSFIGTEIVAIAAGEAKNPRRNLPKAIRRVYIRILLFYIGGVIIIGLLVPQDSIGLDLGTNDAASSPFVIAIKNAGISGLPSVINAALLTSAWSAASSDLYTSSRALYGLALAGNAPKIFSKTLKNGLPVVSIVFCSAFSLLAYMGVKSGSGKVFGWFANMTSVAGLMTWFGISVTYLRFYAGMKAQGIDRSTLPFASKLQPYAAWYSMIACFVICFFSGWSVFLKGKWDTATFVTNYLPLILFPILYIGSKIYYKDPVKRPASMDFVTDIKEIEAMHWPEEIPRNKFEAFWMWLM
ncbi:hypothetical protein D9758_002428 [Tetrapyrgos nigripes]|uniref:Amino acid permease/ SLC12A domain-containing protein n=1 Tax=Tetrapyrgos nigripes TaxID=182062 RepID=A0A8H5LSY6_9AGAR|nr:hypothetical protein D9758_002428 [Tetrapyrgos nigripes]